MRRQDSLGFEQKQGSRDSRQQSNENHNGRRTVLYFSIEHCVYLHGFDKFGLLNKKINLKIL